jgi:hypothetical protein
VRSCSLKELAGPIVSILGTVLVLAAAFPRESKLQVHPSLKVEVRSLLQQNSKPRGSFRSRFGEGGAKQGLTLALVSYISRRDAQVRSGPMRLERLQIDIAVAPPFCFTPPSAPRCAVQFFSSQPQ